ncbi:MAG: hypothetical protein SOY26_04200, partial [Paludibacteraceae bacterium]|nr:hypothetical protein [Paludibacteraceae bacterium]
FISAADKRAILHPNAEPLEATQAGKVMWELDYNEDSHAPAFGTFFKKGDVVCYLQTQHGIEALTAFDHCRLVAVDKAQGAMVVKGDAVCWLEHADLIENVREGIQSAAQKVKEAIQNAVKQADTEVIDAPKSKWKDSMVANK